MKPIAALTALLFVAGAAYAADVDTVKVDGGLIHGVDEEGVNTFKGIPYAAPPVDDLRWRPPQPVVDWDGVRACTEFSADCPYPPYPEGSLYYREPRPQSEDCLYLNVWTTAKPGDDVPVMVWIHGGGFSRGAGSTAAYDGAALAKKGVVLITINYRLNVFGFLAHPELTAESEHDASGNYGLLDMVAALEWVQRNVEQFGGDPDRVTIFGESAGSWAVNALVASPLAKGLFHRAIGQSGGSFGPMTHLAEATEERPSAEDSGVAFGKAAGAESLADMRAIPAEELLDVFMNDSEGQRFPSRPCVDGYFLPDTVSNIFAAGKQNDVPVLIGSNRDEAAAFMAPTMLPKSVEAYEERMEEEYGEDFEAFARLYPVEDDAHIRDAVIHSRSDATFGLSMRTWARMAESGDSPAYLYFFTREPIIPNRDFYGAFHAAEIYYAFDNLDKSDRENDKTDEALADAMSGYWVNFAANGDPNGEGLPEWPAYNAETEPYMELGDQVKLGHHLRKEQLDLHEERARREL
jgi:para-nitrobenzyl esterase